MKDSNMSHYIPDDLFSIDTNAKTIKGQKYGFLTGVMYLAPSDMSGHEVCPMAIKANCKVACLNKSGRGKFTATQNARVNKTRYFFENREAFMAHLVNDIFKLSNKAKKVNLIPLIRLNGTSDIKWENVELTITEKQSKKYGIPAGNRPNIFSVFPEVQFYDYTKIPSRDYTITNYDLTFSYSGAAAYQKYVVQAIKNGARIAAVFRTIDIIPETFLGLPVVSGDNSDIRHMDPKNTIVALYAKGPAITDYSGFVVDVMSYEMQPQKARIIPILSAA